MKMLPWVIRHLAATVVSLAVMACFEDYPTQVGTVTGSYWLRTVNGAALPYTSPGSGAALVGDTITLYQGGTFVWKTVTRPSGASADALTTAGGSYGLLGTSITFTFPLKGNEQRVAQISGDAMTFVEAGVTSIYRK
jgi:hypothetical protein